MAITAGSEILQADIASIYNSFNTFIANYGGSITSLSVPSQNTTIYATALNNLNTKVNEFKSDTYLGTQSAWWIAANNAAIGDLIEASDLTNINTTIGNFSKVKCRNDAFNSHSTNSHSSKADGKNSYSNNSNGSNSHSQKSNGQNYNSAQGNGSHSNGSNSNGSCTHWGDRSFNGCGSNGWNGNSPKWNGTCGDGSQSNGNHWNVNHGNTNHGNGTCTSNGACGTNGDCSANGSCTSYGTCKNTTYIDITNAYKNDT